MKRYLLLTFALFVLCSFKEKEIVWVAIGDSITYLNDHTNETGNRVTKGWLSRVTDELPNLTYINQGHNGWKASDIAKNIEKLGLVKADVYTIFLGTNDWWAGRPVGSMNDYKNATGDSTVFGSFRIIINKLHELNPDAKIVMITPMQRNDFVYILDPNNNAYGSYKTKNGQSLEAFAEAVIAIGKYENIPVIDLYHDPSLDVKKLVNFKHLKDPQTGKYVDYRYPKSTGIPFNPKTDEYPYPPAAINLTYDGLHPSDKGNTIIAEKVVSTFRQIGLAPRWDAYINLDRYMQPFWKADTIVDETAQIIKDSSNASVSLLFPAKKIIAIQTADHSRQFVKGKDWSYADEKIIATANSTMPFIIKDSLLFSNNRPGFSMRGKRTGTFVLFNEGGYFARHQISVTYIPKKQHSWNGPLPKYDTLALPVTLKKLKTGKALNIVFYGNSIEAGYNASGLENAPPFMPAWPELVVYKLRKAYSSRISYNNTSVPGKLAKWGLDSVSSRVNAYHPDLVIIGFGMNDGSGHVPPAQYREQIKGIIDAAMAQNPSTEFILIAPMLPNPDAIQAGLQDQYKGELVKLVKPGVTIADMTGVHRELLKHKTYQDMTGNNVNHPNDYLVRWYAQIISGLLIE